MMMLLPLLVCVAVQQCWGELPVDEVIIARKVPLLGAWSEISPDQADVQEAARHAVETFNTNHKGRKTFKLLSVSAAQSQVTNVINFKLDVILGKTSCLKAEKQEQLKCHFVVTFDPRNDKHQLQSQECTKLTKKKI
ncbi:cystatin-M isoform X2 [Nelusetta ayraudi]|uniref:cystatin-M isoform X2 n=1 Tax=Nelusetta ayraudi TaxID=303726 RepID=UPI003F72535C